MINKSILFMVSLRKRNYESEREILIDAGLITRHTENRWVHYYVHTDSVAELHLANNYKAWSHWHIPLIISARDLVTLFSLKTLNPNLGAESLLQAIKMSARNKHTLKYSGISLGQ